MKILGKVNSIKRLRVNSDGEGVRSVIFLQNCPLSCKWCCNPETRFGSRYKEINEEQLYELIARDRIYFDATGGGITFSGGEPFAQIEFIKAFLKKYSELFTCNIETSLFTSFDHVESIIPFINEWYIDFKMFNELKHMEYTGVSNGIIKQNLELLADRVDTSKIIITFPIITEVNDSYENVEGMINFMKSIKIHRVEFHPYRKNREKKNQKLGLEYEPIASLSPATLIRITKQFKKNNIEIVKHDTQVERAKCGVLKSIRREFCKTNGVPLAIEDCTYKGRCAGTCPKCEEELSYINRWRESTSSATISFS